MVPVSRRGFVRDAAAVLAGLSVCPLACGRSSCSPTVSNGVDIPQETGQGKDAGQPGYVALEKSGLLARREGELWDILHSCELCPRACGVDRIKGEKGVCNSTAELKIYSYGPHFGEEAPLVGRGGSGTIFFSNCNLLCCFCQNWEINHRGDGTVRSPAELANMMLGLQARGCHNINLVTPTHFVPQIVKSVRIAIQRGLHIPIVYNTGGYDNLTVIRLLDGIVDIYLPDFKYQDGALAAKYSSDAVDYPEVAAKVIREMHRQVGELQTSTDEGPMDGVALRGLMIRHLVLPGNIAGTDRFVRWVKETLSPNTFVNIMKQYHPAYRAFEYPEIARRVTETEWRQAVSWAKGAGLQRLDGLD